MVDSPKTGSNELGEAVRHARERLGMSRRDLAESTGLSYPYISQIETGYRMPSTPAMRSLADALGLRPDSLFDAIAPMTGRDAAAGRAAAPTPVRSAEPVPSSPAPSGPGTAVPLTAGRTPAAPGYVPRGTGGPTNRPPSPAAPKAAAEREGPAASEVGGGGAASSFSTVGRASGRPSAAGGSPRSASAGSPAVPIGGIDGADLAADGTDPDPRGPVLTSGGAPARSRTVGAPMERTSVSHRTGSASPDPQRDPAPPGAPANPSPAGAETDPAAGTGGNWITNRSFRRVGSSAAAPPTTTAHPDRAIELATDLLTSLPTEERLPALAEVQARVVHSIIDDTVGRDGVR